MQTSNMQFDFIVVGGGINGLSAASYLCKEGHTVLVLEKQPFLGGGAITSELTLPGFKHDVFATSLNVWRASPIQQDLELEKFGLRVIDPDPVASTPFKNGKAITIYKKLESTLKSIEQFSQKDALKFEEIFRFYMDSKDILLGGLSAPPLSFSTMMSTLESSDTGVDFLQFSYMSARDWIEENFESEEMRAFLSIWGTNHVPLSPEDSASAIFVLVFIGILQDVGCGIPIGGMERVVKAFASYIESHAPSMSITNEAVEKVLVKDGIAEAVTTSSGKTFAAKKGILASVEPKSLFLDLVGEDVVPSEFLRKVRNFRFSKVSQVMIHAALDDWLDYRPEASRRAGIVQIGDSLDQVSRAFNDCVIGKTPTEPFMTINNTTNYDTTRAPAHKHTLWNFVRAPALISGLEWTNDQKEEFADRCIERLCDYAPNARRIVLKRVVLSPQDIQRMNSNLINGDPGVGKATLDQSLALRPFSNWSQYRTPIKNLYMCGSANHPGGGISGLAGHNAAMIVLQDLKAVSS